VTCSEADEIYKICGVIGNPTHESWDDGLKLARDINYQFPQVRFNPILLCLVVSIWGARGVLNLLRIVAFF